MSQKILFIGSMNINNSPTGGVEARSQLLYRFLKYKKGMTLQYIDVSPRSRNLFTYISLLFQIIKYNRIIVSVSFAGVNLLSVLLKFSSKKKITIFIAGGDIENYTNKNNILRLLEKATIVYVQSNSMLEHVKRISNKVNVYNLGNFKDLPTYNKQEKTNNEVNVKFVFVSRVHRDKGVFRAIDTIHYLNEVFSEKEFILDIFGPVDLSPEDKLLFDYELDKQYINYKGYLDFSIPESYHTLSKYHFFIFLTNHSGEGFPGVLIDALHAGNIIIASDWKYNNEIVPKSNLLVNLNDNYQTTIKEYVSQILNLKEDEFQDLIAQQHKYADAYNINNINLKIA